MCEAFIKENSHPKKSIREWRKDSNKHKIEEIGQYSLDSLASHFSQVPAMLCWLYAYHNVSKLQDT